MNKSPSLEQITYPNRWRKGTSGNPKGRPRIDPQIQYLARANTENAIRALNTLLADPKSSDNLRFLCAVALLRAASNVDLVQAFMRNTGMTITQYLFQAGVHVTQREPSTGRATRSTVEKIIQIRDVVLKTRGR